ncbi:MAG TPA: glycerol-3-phosphate 1-O-acyltransferase PlsY [Negativicutes bacterium]|nr:glycerol-3-phosphate 1-O-acyltransferase PlsY [Negativicutes bacterium]
MRYLLVSVIAYLLGNFATAYVVAKAAGKIDIRKFGSGNAGSTNVLRVLGVKAAILVFAGDVLKGVAAVLIGRYLAGSNGALLAGILVVIGHNWPIVLGGKGGKGIATTIGVMLAIDPLIVLFIVVIGVIIIAATRYVSLASVTGVIIFPISMIVTKKPLEYIVFSLILSGMALFKHRSNIGRLINGTESKIGLKKKP